MSAPATNESPRAAADFSEEKAIAAVDRETAALLNPMIGQFGVADTLDQCKRLLHSIGHVESIGNDEDTPGPALGRNLYLLTNVICAALGYELELDIAENMKRHP